MAPSSQPPMTSRNPNAHNSELEKELAALKADLEKAHNEAHWLCKYKVAYIKSKKAEEQEPLIPKPAGDRGKNWNLQEVMGLKDNKPLYNEIMAKANHPYLQKFNWDWPAYEIVKQALIDRCKYKGALKQQAPGDDDNDNTVGAILGSSA
ncbi:hypothetical protein FRB95_013807 [Tulasnella sp. JGI-2019a]|nr:hypothetical protein FRB95_013807 [Tulasnella sp. JGI-2019a]